MAMAFTSSTVVLSLTLILHGHHRVFADLDLMIVHTNDMHARYEQTDVHGTECTYELAKSGQCYGGFPRLKTAVQDARAQAKRENIPSLHLNAGDTFQGTLYYNMFKWKLASALINELSIDVMCLGNHEFDEGLEDLRKFLEHITVPVVCSNLNLTLEPRLQLPILTRSRIIEIGGTKIGFVGYITPETSYLAATENVTFLDEITAMRREIKIMKSQNVNIIIALGHSGIIRDIQIAEKVPDISLIVGGHTHTFMYNPREKLPSIEIPRTNYPHIVTTKTGRKIPIVHAFCKTKYLGKFRVKFNDNGEAISIFGRPLLLNASVKQDDKLLQQVTTMKQKLIRVSSKKIGKTKVFLSMEPTGDIMESNLANLILDSYINYGALKMPDDSSFWTDAPLSFIQGGIIKSNLDHKKNQGVITYGDLLAVLPFENKLVKVKLTGAVIMEALEYSVRRMTYTDRTSFFQEFLQFSGMKVVYDLSKQIGERVKSVTIRCSNCSVPIYTILRLDEVYTVITTSYTSCGGDGYHMIKYKNKGIEYMDSTDLQVFANYIERQKVVYPSIEDRVVILFPQRPSSSSNSFPGKYLICWFSVLITNVLF